MTEYDNQPIRPAATVIIARDASPQYEIFMLRRTNQAVFAGGMYVVPGGRVDQEDHSSVYDEHIKGPSEAQRPQQDALGDEWRGYWITGVRETFEEAGILLAYNSDGNICEYNDDNWQRYQNYRKALHVGELTLAQICVEEKISLAIDLIHFYNRWITPKGRPRRFDTRFFITQAPPAQTGLHDGAETVDSAWISPNDALKQSEGGDFGLMAVTQKQLTSLAEYDSVKHLIAMARDNQAFPTYRPVLPAGT